MSVMLLQPFFLTLSYLHSFLGVTIFCFQRPDVGAILLILIYCYFFAFYTDIISFA